MNQEPSRGKGMWEKMLLEVSRVRRARVSLAVGVSGGADSVALAEALWRLGADPVLWHFNHRWRGATAEADAAWVRRWAQKRKLKFRLGRARKNGRTSEGVARDERWNFFLQQGRRDRVQELWLAHQQDDQAETVLMQFLRGAGPDGLAGMTERGHRGNLRVVRPWLALSRKEVRQGAREAGLEWREDATNQDGVGWRSRVRHKVFPYLEKIYGREIQRVLGRTAGIFSAERNYWEKEIGKIPVHPDVRIWRKRPEAWQRRAIRLWLTDRGLSGPTWEEVENVRKLIEGGHTHKAQLRNNAGVFRRESKLFWIKEMALIAKGKSKC